VRSRAHALRQSYAMRETSTAGGFFFFFFFFFMLSYAHSFAMPCVRFGAYNGRILNGESRADPCRSCSRPIRIDDQLKPAKLSA